MEETVLDRKLRLMTFERVIGQDLVVNALRNQIINNRISHAYLFFGIRGTGKTTTARIFARAINCENPQNGNPCNECPTCRRIMEGRTSLIIEWDGSTNPQGALNIFFTKRLQIILNRSIAYLFITTGAGRKKKSISMKSVQFWH